MELKRMTDQQVAKRMYNYIVRIEKLLDEISKVLNGNKHEVDVEYIRAEYKALKQAIKEDAHYMSLSRNDFDDDSLLQREFKWVIEEAAAYGFETPTNGKIDAGMWRSLEEARYKLTKFTTLEEWKKLSEDQR